MNSSRPAGVRAFVDFGRSRALLTAAAFALVVAVPPLAHAGGRDQAPARPAYVCNPQAECLARAARLEGPTAGAARRDCGRMPTVGTCFAPDETQGDRGTRFDLNRPESPDRPRR